MNDAIKQQISAFVDGELPDNESELLLRRMSQDPELRNQAARYLTIGGAIRGDLSLPSMLALRESIGLAIDDVPLEAGTESTDIAEPRRTAAQGGLMRPVAGVAVAASVAVMALVGLRQLGPADELPAPGLAAFNDRNAVAIDGGAYTEPPAAEFMSDRPSDLLTQYYLSHGQQSSNLGSRLVGLEVREDRLGAAAPSADAANGANRPETADPDTETPAEDAEVETAQ